MFSQSAKFYDAIYSFKDYESEARMVIELTGDKVGGALLDIACGTGSHLKHLSASFKCEGLDLDEGLLEIARSNLPNVPLHAGDMTCFDLGRKFDVVTCLFSSIGYVQTQDGLDRAFAQFAAHTAPGGMLLVEPWFSPEAWNPSHMHALFIDEPDLKLARMSAPGVEGRISTVRFEYLISTMEHGIERATEEHRLGLFTREEYTAALEGAGYLVEYQEKGLSGRGLYVCRMP